MLHHLLSYRPAIYYVLHLGELAIVKVIESSDDPVKMRKTLQRMSEFRAYNFDKKASTQKKGVQVCMHRA